MLRRCSVQLLQFQFVLLPVPGLPLPVLPAMPVLHGRLPRVVNHNSINATVRRMLCFRLLQVTP